MQEKTNEETINYTTKKSKGKGDNYFLIEFIIFYIERSSSETKLSIYNRGNSNQKQNFLKSSINGKNNFSLKNSKNLYIKNPYIEGFNTINSDYKNYSNGKYSTFESFKLKRK